MNKRELTNIIKDMIEEANEKVQERFTDRGPAFRDYRRKMENSKGELSYDKGPAVIWDNDWIATTYGESAMRDPEYWYNGVQYDTEEEWKNDLGEI